MATHTDTEDRGRVGHRRNGSTRSAAQSLSTLVGLALIALGVTGFIPSLTTNSADLANSGPDSQTLVFGLYQVSVLQNLVHVVAGVLALMAANGPRIAKTFLILGGLGFLALTAYGFSIDLASDDNVLSLNQNGNWLHFGVGIAMMFMGALTLRGRGHRKEKVVEGKDHRDEKIVDSTDHRDEKVVDSRDHRDEKVVEDTTHRDDTDRRDETVVDDSHRMAPKHEAPKRNADEEIAY